MRAHRALAAACALGLLAGVAAVGPAAARSTVWHFTAVGPGAQASWENGDGVTTSLFVFNQLNAPGTRGYFEEVLIAVSGGSGDGAWYAVYDSWGAAQQPTIMITSPLVAASVVATVPFAGCFEGPCPDLPLQLDVTEQWTGLGAIDRMAGPREVFADVPGLQLTFVHDTNFFRAADLADADPFDGALAPLGALQSARFFDVHIAQVSICHAGVVCE